MTEAPTRVKPGACVEQTRSGLRPPRVAQVNR